MSEAGSKKAAIVTRDELYRQVWETPMSRLAEKYGISGNGLKKICKRLHVPCPPRGYWAKLAAGKRVKPAPLREPPIGRPAQVTIAPTAPPSAAPRLPELDPETAQQLAEARVRTAGLVVPATLRKPHPVIAAWIARHQAQIEADKRDLSRWGRSTLLTKAFSSLERRQQRFLSTLFKEAEKLGYKVKGEAPYNTVLETGQNRIEFALRERVRQVRRPLSDAEKSTPYNSGRSWTQERIATGELIFAFKTFLGPGLTSEWRDGEQPLEIQIGEILAVLAVAAPLLERRRQEAEQAERRRWEEEKKRREEHERQQDRNRWRRFIEFAKLWQEAQLARDFLAALERLSPEPEGSFWGSDGGGMAQVGAGTTR